MYNANRSRCKDCKLLSVLPIVVIRQLFDNGVKLGAVREKYRKTEDFFVM
jgi:hypothetical protein